MKDQVTRRNFLATAGVATLATTSTAALGADAGDGGIVKLLGVACSMRPGKTTAAGIQAALAAARESSPRIRTDFVDLGGKDIWTGALGRPNADGSPVKDDFDAILPKLQDPLLAGIIIGSPSYFRTLSAQCKLFLERCAVLRKPTLQLAGKVVGVLAVGGYRNGGQELVIEQIQSVMLCHEALIVGGKPPAHQGATLWNVSEDDIAQDTIGMESARKLGIRVAEAALKQR